MAQDLVRRHIWLIDTLDKYGKLSRKEISRLWQQSYLNDGSPMPERTFHHHRRKIEENFHITISCNSAGEYFIEEGESPKESAFCRYLLNSYVINDTLTEVPEISRFIMVDEIPSSREFLPRVLEAIKKQCKVKFSHQGFNRSVPDRGICFSPLFVKLYKQRWYMIGIKESIAKIRTYALDRVLEMNILNENISEPVTADISPGDFFENCIGVTQSMAPPKNVRLRVSAKQAKYFRALPFHHSQKEVFSAPEYSIFSYKLKINYELIHEILSFGPSVTVEAPAELKLNVINELQRTIANYPEGSL